MTRVAVVTIVHGRLEQLGLQHPGLMRSLVTPHDYVVVAMDDPAVSAWSPYGSLRPRVVAQDAGPDGLGLSAARNAGAETALEHGADLLVFLDVDCIPSVGLVGSYVTAFERFDSRVALLCGPVAYLPAPPSDGYDLRRLADLAEPHPSRPAPLPGVVDIDRTGHDLFWSLSFAVGRETWGRIGGFDERFVGYGGEDTDFGRRAAEADVPLAWVGGARAFHQHHPVSNPPVEHVTDIVRNAGLFFDRWGAWPMGGWLDAFVDLGLVELVGGRYVRTDAPKALLCPQESGRDLHHSRS